VPEATPIPKREKRRVNLAGHDPLEVLRRLLATPPEKPAKPDSDPAKTR
jgi:hypothetical protein